MKLNWRRSIAVWWLLSAVATGCATARPQPSGRKGLLEDAATSDHGHRSNRFAGLERTRAARAAAGAELKHSQGAMSGRSEGSSAGGGAGLGAGGGKTSAVALASGALRWPLQQVSVTSPFGQRGREFHEGVDLKALQGTPVLAAQEGTVIYAGSKIRGYGKMVVLRHFRQISTIYAHNSQLLVKMGQYVRQGQKIAITGKTGHVTGPHLHFEIRDGTAALNPLDLLPVHPVIAVSDLSSLPAAANRRPAFKARPKLVASAPAVRARVQRRKNAARTIASDQD